MGKQTEYIRFTEPATRWEEALPLGNGKLGAMLFSEVGAERIQLNEESVWYGGLMDRNNPDAKAHLQEFRDHIFEGRLREATDLALNAFSGTPQSMRQYQNLGDLTIYSNGGVAEDYRGTSLFKRAVHFCTGQCIGDAVLYRCSAGNRNDTVDDASAFL